MKKSFLYLILLIGVQSCNKGYDNYDNLLKVKVGMSYKEATAIMKVAPNEVEDAFWADTLFVNYYDPPFAASDNLSIAFSKKDSIVVDINYGH